MSIVEPFLVSAAEAISGEVHKVTHFQLSHVAEMKIVGLLADDIRTLGKVSYGDMVRKKLDCF